MRSGIPDCNLPGMVLRRAGLSKTEVIAVLALVAILLSIFIPYVRHLRDRAHRVACASQLRQFNEALNNYSAANNGALPRVRLDTANPDHYVAYTGDGLADPFTTESPVRPNDVTASLWLLVRLDLCKPEVFVCPASSADPAVIELPASWGNFARGTLAYSYAMPFSSREDYSFTSDRLQGNFAVMADLNPGEPDVPDPGVFHADASPLVLAKGNSPNHRGAGQNVLYGTGLVEFRSTPFTGEGGDNIYSALRQTPLLPGETPPANGRGVWSRNVGPAWHQDSYLVPTAND